MERPSLQQLVNVLLFTSALWNAASAQYTMGISGAAQTALRKQLLDDLTKRMTSSGVRGFSQGTVTLFPPSTCACPLTRDNKPCGYGTKCACHIRNGPTCVPDAQWTTMMNTFNQKAVTVTYGGDMENAGDNNNGNNDGRDDNKPSPAAAIDPKAISTFNDYLVNGCSGANTEYPKPTSLTNTQWSSLCGRLSGDHCILNSVKCSSSEVLFYDTTQLPGKKVPVAKGVYATGAVMLITPTGKALGPALNRKAASAFSSFILNGCASPANKLYPKPSSLSSSTWSALCGNLSGEHCAPNGVKCGKDEVLFYDVTALPDKKVAIAAGVYATGAIEIRN